MFDLLSSLVQDNVLVAILSLALILWAALVFVTRRTHLDTMATTSVSRPQQSFTNLKTSQSHPTTQSQPTPLLPELQLHQEPPTMTTTAPTPTDSTPPAFLPWRASFSLTSFGPRRSNGLMTSYSAVGRKGSGSTCGRWSSEDGGSEKGGSSRYGSFAGESAFAGIGGQFGGGAGQG